MREDLECGDPTSDLVDRASSVKARIIAKRDGVVSGTSHATTIFGMKDCHTDIKIRDGHPVHNDEVIMMVHGIAADVLSLERVVLNLMSRMSGIATVTKKMASHLPHGVELLATRKTAPGLRIFDKEAVEAGGGRRHRMNLGEMIMIKDNHMAVTGHSLERIVKKALLQQREFEVEVDTPSDAILAAKLGAPIILLDNFTPDMILNTIESLKKNGLRDAVKLEASGGITDDNIAEYGATGIDYVSSGYITNSVTALDLSLEM